MEKNQSSHRFLTCAAALGASLMEGRVGFRLFDRTTRHVELTVHGKELLAVIQRNLEELDAAIANIGRSAKRSHQSISLGTTPLVAANILPHAMREFRKLRPDVRIQLFDADCRH